MKLIKQLHLNLTFVTEQQVVASVTRNSNTALTKILAMASTGLGRRMSSKGGRPRDEGLEVVVAATQSHRAVVWCAATSRRAEASACKWE
jgi:hypothetical protein